MHCEKILYNYIFKKYICHFTVLVNLTFSS